MGNFRMMAHEGSQSMSHGLMNSLFDLSETSCLVLFATSVCFT